MKTLNKNNVNITKFFAINIFFYINENLFDPLFNRLNESQFHQSTLAQLLQLLWNTLNCAGPFKDEKIAKISYTKVKSLKSLEY